VIANHSPDTAWSMMPGIPSSPPVPPIFSLTSSSSAADSPKAVETLSTAALRQYLLVCHARTVSINRGTWCFSLETLSGEPLLDAECEDDGDLNRLSLLAAVRGLESIDGKGLVSLISNNRYLIRSLDRSLPRWRENDFVWEQFGRKMPVQNADLWRRIDRILGIHCVTASLLQTTRVSTGASRFDSFVEPPQQPFDEEPMLRFDRPHATPHATASPGQRDGLRRWLAGNCDAAPIVTRRGRYRAADLAGD
jgi:ribonuclease HI